MVAPRMIGHSVRPALPDGAGSPAYVAVEQDASGRAWKTALAVAKGIGATRAAPSRRLRPRDGDRPIHGAGYLRGRRPDPRPGVRVLVEQGFDPEMVALELYGSYETAEIFAEMARTGFFRQGKLHSRTSQYGTFSRGPVVLPDSFKR